MEEPTNSHSYYDPHVRLEIEDWIVEHYVCVCDGKAKDPNAANKRMQKTYWKIAQAVLPRGWRNKLSPEQLTWNLCNHPRSTSWRQRRPRRKGDMILLLELECSSIEAYKKEVDGEHSNPDHRLRQTFGRLTKSEVVSGLCANLPGAKTTLLESLNGAYKMIH